MKRLPPLELDVRPLIERQRPPLPAILDAVSRLEEGQPLRLIAPFEPAPLYTLLGERGFDHSTREDPPGVWVIDFTPRDR